LVLQGRIDSSEAFVSNPAHLLKASRAALEAENAFIAKAEFLQPLRHLNVRGPIQEEMLRLRLAYLRLLAAEIHVTEAEPC